MDSAAPEIHKQVLFIGIISVIAIMFLARKEYILYTHHHGAPQSPQVNEYGIWNMVLFAFTMVLFVNVISELG